jgi:hypothetical protein
MTNIETLVVMKLEDMAAQCELLFAQGNHADAELLRHEGLLIAKAYDFEQDFLFVNDLSIS